jgi:Arc/MetJ family transcription regulator
MLPVGDTQEYGILTHQRAKGMRTNIDIDDRLMQQAMRSSRSRTKRAAVEEGLRLLIQTRAQATIRQLRGKIRWNGDLHKSRLTRLAE